MSEMLTSQLIAVLQIVLIDLVLAGDNAVVVGMAAAGLEPKLRRRAIVIGIVVATLLRICLAAVAVQLLADGPDSVQYEAREASVGVLPLVAQETVRPGGGVGMATQPVVS